MKRLVLIILIVSLNIAQSQYRCSDCGTDELPCSDDYCQTCLIQKKCAQCSSKGPSHSKTNSVSATVTHIPSPSQIPSPSPSPSPICPSCPACICQFSNITITTGDQNCNCENEIEMICNGNSTSSSPSSSPSLPIFQCLPDQLQITETLPCDQGSLQIELEELKMLYGVFLLIPIQETVTLDIPSCNFTATLIGTMPCESLQTSCNVYYVKLQCTNETIILETRSTTNAGSCSMVLCLNSTGTCPSGQKLCGNVCIDDSFICCGTTVCSSEACCDGSTCCPSDGCVTAGGQCCGSSNKVCGSTCCTVGYECFNDLCGQSCNNQICNYPLYCCKGRANDECCTGSQKCCTYGADVDVQCCDGGLSCAHCYVLEKIRLGLNISLSELQTLDFLTDNQIDVLEKEGTEKKIKFLHTQKKIPSKYLEQGFTYKSDKKYYDSIKSVLQKERELRRSWVSSK